MMEEGIRSTSTLLELLKKELVCPYKGSPLQWLLRCILSMMRVLYVSGK